MQKFTKHLSLRRIYSVALLLTVASLLLALLGACARSSARGVIAGALAPVDGGPHGVSSQSQDDHHVEPITYPDDQAAAKVRLLASLARLPRVRVVEDHDSYLHATATSLVMRFTDDLEFYFSAPGIIQVRSVARIGYYDFGVNRRRIETLRAAVSTPQRK